MAGEDGRWLPATANASTGGTVLVTSPEVQSPKYVRYGWRNAPPLTCSILTVCRPPRSLPRTPFRPHEPLVLELLSEEVSREAPTGILAKPEGVHLQCWFEVSERASSHSLPGSPSSPE